MKIEFNKVTWYSKLGAVILFLFVIPTLTFYMGERYQEVVSLYGNVTPPTQSATSHTKIIPTTTSLGFLDGAYVLDDEKINFVNGTSKGRSPSADSVGEEAGIFGQPTLADINGDGQKDAVFYISEQTSGTGIFFYVASAIAKNGKYIPTNTVFLGDRIAPQNIAVEKDGTIEANYAVRKDSDPMTADPSVGVTKFLLFRNNSLVETKK